MRDEGDRDEVADIELLGVGAPQRKQRPGLSERRGPGTAQALGVTTDMRCLPCLLSFLFG